MLTAVGMTVTLRFQREKSCARVVPRAKLAGAGERAGAVAAGVEPDQVIDIEDDRTFCHHVERGKGGEQLAGNPGDIGLPGAGRAAARAAR